MMIVPNNTRNGVMSPTIMNFPKNDHGDPTTPNPPSKTSIKTEDTKKTKNSNKRKRKNKGQIKKLEEEFQKNPHWTNEDVDKISADLRLDKSQVYKWNWDQKKKLNILPSKVYVVQMPSDGTGKNDQKQVYVKSIQDVIKLQQLANSNKVKKE
jgi:hypothetical protein